MRSASKSGKSVCLFASGSVDTAGNHRIYWPKTICDAVCLCCLFMVCFDEGQARPGCTVQSDKKIGE